MKKLAMIGLFVLCLISQVQAQRYLPEQRGIQITAGTVNGIGNMRDFHVGAAFSQYTQNRNRWVFGGEYLEKRHLHSESSISQSQFTAEAGYYINFLSDRSRTFFFSVGASALAGYETINFGNSLLPNGATIENRDGFIYGGALTFEMEIFIIDRIALLVNVRQRVLFGSSVGRFNTQFGTGVKFIIN